MGSWRLLGFGYWAITERGSGEYLGEIGFREGLRETRPRIEGKPEAGWALAPASWGKGIASEALEEILRWGDAHLSSDVTVCLIEPEHAASIRVAEKAGYAPFARSELFGDTVTLFERFRNSACLP